MDLMISKPPRRQVIPIDFGFVSASLSATLATVVSNHREKEKVTSTQRSQLQAEVKKRFVPFIISNTGRTGVAADKYLTELLQLNRIPHVYDAKLSKS